MIRSAFLLLFTLLVAPAWATDPTLPQLSVTTTDPSLLGSYRRTVDCTANAGNAAAQATCLTNAVDTANVQYGDLILTEPGATLDGNWVLGQPGGTFLSPSATGATAVSGSSGAGAVAGSSGAAATSATGTVNNFVTIRPSGFDSAVPIGTRATSAHTASMTKLRGVASSAGAGHSDSVIQIPVTGGTEYYWLSGLEVVPKSGTFGDGALIYLSPSSNADNPAHQADHMMVDRVYIHGDDPSGTNGGPGTLRGLQFAGAYVGAINSTIDDIKMTDAQGEGQAITMGFGAGPVHIENNLLGATAQSVLFETPTGERFTATVQEADKTVITRGSGLFGYDIVSKTLNLAGSNTVTVVSRDSDTQITVTPALTGLTYSLGVATAIGYIDYDRSGNPSFFPGDTKILRNHFRKKDAWNIADASFDRTTGNDLFGGSAISLTIDGSDNTKATNANVAFNSDHAGRAFYITGGTGFITGYAYIASVSGAVATFNRELGTTGSTGGTARLKYSVKNALELKSDARVLVEGNVFDGDWSGGQPFILTFTPRYTNSPAGDLTFQYNVVKNTYAIAVFYASEANGPDDGSPDGGATPPPWLQNDRILFQHNLFKNIQTTTTSSYWALGSPTYSIFWVPYAAPGALNGVTASAAAIDDFQFIHNTIADCTIDGALFKLGSGENPAGFTKGQRFILKDNVLCSGPTPFDSTWSGGTWDTNALNEVTDSSTRTVTKNVFFDTSDNGSSFSSPDTGNVMVTTGNRSTIGFADYANGDYSITSGTYNNWASDGTDPGVDFTTLATKISGVE